MPAFKGRYSRFFLASLLPLVLICVQQVGIWHAIIHWNHQNSPSNIEVSDGQIFDKTPPFTPQKPCKQDKASLFPEGHICSLFNAAALTSALISGAFIFALDAICRRISVLIVYTLSLPIPFCRYFPRAPPH